MAAEFLGLDVGSWADWVAGSATAVALLLAAGTYRREVKDRKERAELERTAQARNVSVQTSAKEIIWDNPPVPFHITFAVTNYSGLAIRDASVVYQAEGKTHRVQIPGNHPDDHYVGATIMPGTYSATDRYSKYDEVDLLALCFTDAYGVLWDKDMKTAAILQGVENEKRYKDS